MRFHLLALGSGKRRYDRKQSGYGGQTKPVFHKKVRVKSQLVVIQRICYRQFSRPIFLPLVRFARMYVRSRSQFSCEARLYSSLACILLQAKTTKKIVLRLQCQSCKCMHQVPIKVRRGILLEMTEDPLCTNIWGMRARFLVLQSVEAFIFPCFVSSPAMQALRDWWRQEGKEHISLLEAFPGRKFTYAEVFMVSCTMVILVHEGPKPLRCMMMTRE